MEPEENTIGAEGRAWAAASRANPVGIVGMSVGLTALLAATGLQVGLPTGFALFAAWIGGAAVTLAVLAAHVHSRALRAQRAANGVVRP